MRHVLDLGFDLWSIHSERIVTASSNRLFNYGRRNESIAKESIANESNPTAAGTESAGPGSQSYQDLHTGTIVYLASNIEMI